VDFIANIHNRQREFNSRVSGMRTNYRLSYHFPINPNTSSNYARLKYAAILKQSIHLLFRLLHSFMPPLPVSLTSRPCVPPYCTHKDRFVIYLNICTSSEPICRIFKDGVSNSDYVVSNKWMALNNKLERIRKW
jgi:hypothetical protein